MAKFLIFNKVVFVRTFISSHLNGHAVFICKEISIVSPIAFGLILFKILSIDSNIDVPASRIQKRDNRTFECFGQFTFVFDKMIFLVHYSLHVVTICDRFLPAPGCGNLGVDSVEGHACSRAALGLPTQFSQYSYLAFSNSFTHSLTFACNSFLSGRYSS